MYVCIYVNVCMHVFQTDLQAEHTVTQACRLVESLTHAQRERERCRGTTPEQDKRLQTQT